MKKNLSFNNAKKIFGTWLKDKDFLSTHNNRIYLQDHGFYLTVFEISPLHNSGFVLDMGIKFMWSSYYGISYDYSDCDTRVCSGYSFNAGMGAVFFDDANIGDEINLLKADAIKKIESYKEIENFETFKYKIENRDDFAKRANPGFEKRDVSLAIIKMFTEDRVSAEKILDEGAIKNPVALRLSKNDISKEVFRNELIAIINECRSAMSDEHCIDLPPITQLWKTL